MLLQNIMDRAPEGRDGFETVVKCWAPMLDTLPGWFWSVDENYRLTFVSDNVGRITGPQPSDLEGISILDPAYGDELTEAGIDTYYRALRAQRPFENLCYERNMKEGTRVVLMDSARPVFDKENVFRGFNGISLHISHATEKAGATSGLVYGLKSRADALEEELSRRNADLEENNKLLSEVLEAMGEGLVVTSSSDLFDPATTIEIVNPAYRNLFGLKEHEVQVGMSVPKLVQQQILNGDVPSDMQVVIKMVEDMVAGRTFLMDMPTQKRPRLSKVRGVKRTA